MKKVVNEINQYGSPVEPKDIYKNRDIPIGPGSKSLDDADAFIIYLLYLEEPSRILSSYVEGLEHIRGIVVSEATVRQFFQEGFPFSAGLYRPNLVPYDKFHPANLERALEYLTFTAMVDPARIKFGDEKLLKGRNLSSAKCDAI